MARWDRDKRREEGNEGFKNNHLRSIGRRIHRNLTRSQRAPERKKDQRVTDPNQKNHQLGLQETEAAMHFHLYGKGAINYHDSSFRMFFHLLLCFLPYPNLGPLQIWVNAQDWAKSGEAGESPILFLSFSGMGLVVHGLFLPLQHSYNISGLPAKSSPRFPIYSTCWSCLYGRHPEVAVVHPIEMLEPDVWRRSRLES